MTNKKCLPLLAKRQAAIKSKRNDLIQTLKALYHSLSKLAIKRKE